MMKIRSIFNEGLDKLPENLDDLNAAIVDGGLGKDSINAVQNAIDTWEEENNKKGLTKNFQSALKQVLIDTGINPDNNNFVKFVKEADDNVLKTLTGFGAQSLIKFFKNEKPHKSIWEELLKDTDLLLGSAQDVIFKLNVVNEILTNPNDYVNNNGKVINLDLLKSNGKYKKAADIKAITDHYIGEKKDNIDLGEGITFESWLNNNNYKPPYGDKSTLQKAFDTYIQKNVNKPNVKNFASDISQTLEQPKQEQVAYKELMGYKVNKDEKDINNIFDAIFELTKLSKSVKKVVDGMLLEEILIIKGIPRTVEGVKKYFNENIFKNLDKELISKLQTQLDTFLSNPENLIKILELEFSSIKQKIILSQLISLLKMVK